MATVVQQNQSAEVHEQASSIQINKEEEYTIFSYRDEMGVYGYYMNSSYYHKLLNIGTEASSTSFGTMDEMCPYLEENQRLHSNKL